MIQMSGFEKKISVIVPVYNTERYVGQCLESILASKVENMEIIAVDDGSTDRSPEILRMFQDPRLKVYRKGNEGVFKTWKYGVERSTGEYIVFVDSDDYVSPDLFGTVEELLCRRDYDLIQHGWVEIYKRSRRRICGMPDIPQGEYVGEELQRIKESRLYFLGQTKGKFPVLRWAKVFRAALLKEILPETMEDISMYEDDSICRPYLSQIESMYFLDENLYYHRCDVVGSICNSPEKLPRYLDDVENLLAYFEEKRVRFGFPEETLEYYRYFYHLSVAGEAARFCNDALAKRILSEPKMCVLMDRYGKGLKPFLLKHKLFTLYRVLRKGKNALRLLRFGTERRIEREK